jgi:hypothetical protein
VSWPILKRNSNSVCAPTKMTLHLKTAGVLMRLNNDTTDNISSGLSTSVNDTIDRYYTIVFTFSLP